MLTAGYITWVRTFMPNKGIFNRSFLVYKLNFKVVGIPAVCIDIKDKLPVLSFLSGAVHYLLSTPFNIWSNNNVNQAA